MNQYPMSGGNYRQNFQNTPQSAPPPSQSAPPPSQSAPLPSQSAPPRQQQYGVGMLTPSSIDSSSINSHTTGNSLYQQPLNQFGLRDKVDSGTGLMQTNPLTPQFTTLENTIVIDTRDCIGSQSLNDARIYFNFTGGRGPAQGTILGATNTNPIVVTLNSVANLKNGDTVTFRGVGGNTNTNGIHRISFVTPGPNTVVITAGSNGVYSGGGTWNRAADQGWPEITDKDSTILGNVLTVNLEKEIKNIRSISLFHIVVPRDIIPLLYWLPDFINASTDNLNKTYTPISVTTSYITQIPQESKWMNFRMIGFYSTPLDMWRTYTFGAFSMQNQVTPPPLQLWNPPGPGPWPLQPLPYPFQTVPTYRSNNFSIPGNPDPFYIILSGYGVYDFVDWTIVTGNPTTDAVSTSIIRKLLLFAICPIQSLNNVFYPELILNCRTTSNTNTLDAFGFGDFQRYLPGAGIGQNYQPGTNSAYNLAHAFPASGNPTQITTDNPIPFPNFRGNVWGPYDAPGDRFQKMGLRDTIQDLFLNGDLNNLLGSPVIIPSIPIAAIPLDPSFGLNFSAFISVNLGNVQNSTNPNITNAMRITSNGFGAVSIRAQGGGATYIDRYQSAGGIGPSNLGVPNAWVNTGVYGGPGTFSDPIAQGPAGPNPTPYTSDASSIGTGTDPSHRTSFNDLGTNNGAFQYNIQNYIGYCVNDIPDTDLIIRIEEALRDDRAQSTRSFNSDALLDVPIRLNVGATTGTQQYIESLQSLLAQATGYWEKRYFNPKSSLHKLHLNFFSYAGQPIPLERMLQARSVLSFLNLFLLVNQTLDINFDTNPFFLSFLFDPLNPQLIGRMKRYFQIIFKAQVYEGQGPGLEPTKFSTIPPGPSLRSDIPMFS
jgi:hypothetical protein